MNAKWLTTALTGLGLTLAFAAGCPQQETGRDSTASSPATGTAVPAAPAEGPTDWAARWPAVETGIKAVACDKSETALRPLDDPDNPYQGRYSEIDYWCLAHADPDEAQLMQYWAGTAPQDYQVINAVVDRDGFLVPQLEVYRLNIILAHLPDGEEFQRGEYTYLDVDSVMVHPDSNKCMRSFHAGGVVTPGLRESFEAGICERMAPYVPAVPDWLAADPPLVALLMYDGEIATYGEPGSDDGGLLSVHGAEQAAAEPWLRYSQSGDLLGRAEPPTSWVALYFPDYQELRADYESRGGKVQVQGGMVFAMVLGDISSKSVFDYRGEPLDQATMTEAPPLPYEEVPGRLLKHLHAAQQARAADPAPED